MAARSFLFRLFLASILVLNGIGSAMAGVHHAAGAAAIGVHSETGAGEPDAQAADDGAHAGCDEPDPMLAGHDSPNPGDSQSSGHPADCCGPGTCKGTCANTGVSALTSVPHDGFDTPGQASARPTISWHAAPTLPHLIRPPIA